MKIENLKVSELKPYGNNPRKTKQLDVLVQSLEGHGFINPIIAYKHNGENLVICGHQRLKAAIKLGQEEVPVIFPAFKSLEQARAYLIMDNRSSEVVATWDKELLTAELDDLMIKDVDLALTGWSSVIRPKIKQEPDPSGLIDKELKKKVKTKVGDLYVIDNRHRLLCGDSTDGKDVNKLMEVKATMMFTDPPWNVAIGMDSNPRHRQREGLINDKMSGDKFLDFLNGFIQASTKHIMGDVYCVLGASECPRLDQALRDNGYHWSATVIWCKDIFVLGRSKYHRRYEPIWYGWHEKAKSSFGTRRDLDDVWEIPRPRVSAEHPTMKPVEVPRQAIENSSKKGEVVLDLFGGSGTTMIAAEQLKRKCYMMELDPKYCDVILARYAALNTKCKITKNGKAYKLG